MKLYACKVLSRILLISAALGARFGYVVSELDAAD